MKNALTVLLTSGLVAIALVLGTATTINWYLTQEVDRLAQDVETKVTDAKDVAAALALKAKDMRLHVVQVQQWLTDICATRGAEGFDDGFDEAAVHGEAFHTLIEEFRQYFESVQDEAALAETDALAGDFDAYYEMGRRMAQAYIKGGPELGNPMMEKFDPFAADLEDRIEPFVSGRIEALNQAIEQVRQDTITVRSKLDRMAYTSAVSVVVVLVCCAAFWLVLRARVFKPLQSVRSVLSDIEQRSDLTKQLSIHRNDEIGQLAQSVNSLLSSMNNIISEVGGMTREVAAAATQIAASGDEMSQGMNDQNQQMFQIASAIEEMSASVVEVARKSGEAASNAAESGQIAQEGGGVVDQTIEGMRAISEAVSAGADSVTELGKRGEQIGKIIDVINDIADQTNLLALNAAIEAARAGEHGRGFAVVADEVRKLADRTTKATNEIAESIKAIQTETGEAVQRMNAGTGQVAAGVQSATEAGESLKKIVTSAQEVAGMIQSIAAAAEQQSAASEEVSRNVDAVSAVSRQANESAQQAAMAASQLSTKAEQLQVLVSKFKTTNHAT